jgi:hypothetical protein
VAREEAGARRRQLGGGVAAAQPGRRRAAPASAAEIRRGQAVGRLARRRSGPPGVETTTGRGRGEGDAEPRRVAAGELRWVRGLREALVAGAQDGGGGMDGVAAARRTPLRCGHGDCHPARGGGEDGHVAEILEGEVAGEEDCDNARPFCSSAMARGRSGSDCRRELPQCRWRAKEGCAPRLLVLRREKEKVSGLDNTTVRNRGPTGARLEALLPRGASGAQRCDAVRHAAGGVRNEEDDLARGPARERRKTGSGPRGGGGTVNGPVAPLVGWLLAWPM